MKEFIASHAWTRVQIPLPEDQPFADLDVVYNLGYGDPAHSDDPCVIQIGKRAAGNASACSVTSSVSSAASTVVSRYVLSFNIVLPSSRNLLETTFRDIKNRPHLN
jgi:hypothetical protein